MDKDARAARLDAAWGTYENQMRRLRVWARQWPISEKRLSRRIIERETRLRAEVIEIETHDPGIVALLAKMGFTRDE